MGSAAYFFAGSPVGTGKTCTAIQKIEQERGDRTS
jgi:hypothetical protein